MNDAWYYADGEQSVGPLTFLELRDALAHFPDARNILIWRDGYKDWLEAERIPELSAYLVKPPPLKKKPIAASGNHEPTQQPHKRGGCATALLVILVLFVGALLISGNRVNENLLKSLKADTARCQRVIDRLTRLGIIREIRRGGDSSRVIVDDLRWAAAEHDDKVSTALSTYCLHSPADGHYKVYVEGLRDGKIRGSVINGNWWSN